MIIDPKNLRPLVMTEFRADGVFYQLMDDGSYESAHVWQYELDAWEKKGQPWKKFQLKWEIEQLCKQGKLFVNKDRPFKRISEK